MILLYYIILSALYTEQSNYANTNVVFNLHNVVLF